MACILGNCLEVLPTARLLGLDNRNRATRRGRKEEMAYDFMGHSIDIGSWIAYGYGSDTKLGLVIKVCTTIIEHAGYLNERNKWVCGPRQYTYLRVQGIRSKERKWAVNGVGRIEHPSRVVCLPCYRVPPEWRETMQWALGRTAEGRAFLTSYPPLAAKLSRQVKRENDD